MGSYLKKCKIQILKGSVSLFINLTQFSLTLAGASTAPKVKVLSLEQVVINFDVRKQKSLGQEYIYRTLSRAQGRVHE